jgi:hypothetical protein
MSRAQDEGNQHVTERIRADMAYLRATLGERAPISQYIRETQGCDPMSWTDERIEQRRNLAVQALAATGAAP